MKPAKRLFATGALCGLVGLTPLGFTQAPGRCHCGGGAGR